VLLATGDRAGPQLAETATSEAGHRTLVETARSRYAPGEHLTGDVRGIPLPRLVQIAPRAHRCIGYRIGIVDRWPITGNRGCRAVVTILDDRWTIVDNRGRRTLLASIYDSGRRTLLTILEGL
jgi:hypothetical protein